MMRPPKSAELVLAFRPVQRRKTFRGQKGNALAFSFHHRRMGDDTGLPDECVPLYEYVT